MRLATGEIHPIDRALLSFCDPAGELLVNDVVVTSTLLFWVQFSRELPLA